LLKNLFFSNLRRGRGIDRRFSIAPGDWKMKQGETVFFALRG
jgi:hypothetical protein